MNFSVTCDTSSLETELQGWEQKKLPYATATALTRTAKKIQTAYIKAMEINFDRPTPYILHSTYIKIATASRLTAEVGWKQDFSTPATRIMLPQVEGGERLQKRSEIWLSQKGYLPGGMVMVPGKAARLDSYGNMSRGQLVQLLSALRAFPECGYDANRAFKVARKRLAAAKRQAQFFVGKPGGGRLPLGVYQRTAHGVKPILVFVNTPTYRVRFPWTQIADEVYEANFQEEFNRALRDMLILGPFIETE